MIDLITTLNRRIDELEEAHGDVIASLRDGDVKKALEVATKQLTKMGGETKCVSS